jgi:polyphosphate kinase
MENFEVQKTNTKYIHRDISWLAFNYRVLQEAKDTSVPLLEQLKFLAIYSSNLDEFFRVRVGQLKNFIRAGKRTQKELDFEPKALFKEILTIINKQQQEFSQIMENKLNVELPNHNVFILRRLDLSNEQKEYVENYFQQNMLPFVQPVLLMKDMIRVFLNNSALYLVIRMVLRSNPAGPEQFAIVKVPSDHMPRFLRLPSPAGEHHIIMLDDVVRHNTGSLFPGFLIQDTYSIKLTRDAELYIDDEFEGDLLSKIKSSLIKRNVGPPSRLVYDREIPKNLLQYLKTMFQVENADLLPEGRYHNNFDFFNFPSLGLNHLKYTPLPPLRYTALEDVEDYYESLREREHLLAFPFQSYESVVRFFEQAAKDPLVTHIKLIQYRVAKESRIMDALIEAVDAGKHVSVFIEVKARFDEEANLKWGEQLQKAGVKVHYSFPGLKVHAKLALVRRVENKSPQWYGYMSTGNFNENTAKIYTDFGLFTTDTRLIQEIASVFSLLETGQFQELKFEHLLVGQFNLKDKLIHLIDNEIQFARSGKEALIILKMNSIEDAVMIDKLYEASKAGVQVKLIVRGICCLKPGVPGLSENIECISIVDRFLEHSRIFYFRNGGDEKLYLSSADWMRRNLNYRIEAAFPVYNKGFKEKIMEIIQLQLNDNVKARVIDKDLSNKYRKNNHYLVVRSQTETYFYLKRKSENQH